MKRLVAVLTILIFCASSAWPAPSAPKKLRDLYFGEALYYAFQGDWFDSVARLDTELAQHYRVDEPERDTLHYHVNQAEFDVGDFELAYRMHRRAGRAIKAVIEGNVEETVRNEAIYRLARIYFQKDQPENALHAVERIHGDVPAKIRADLAFLRANIAMANNRNADAVRILKGLQKEKSLEGFSSYNLGIALLRNGDEQNGLEYLDRTGRIEGSDPATLAIKDKANLVLGDRLMSEKKFEAAKAVLDRVRLSGPFSDRALLGSGWADASREQFERALVPWTILSERAVTDAAVQEAMLAVPYAYGRLGVFGKAALMYGKALEAFGKEINKLDASITSIREGRFLKALVRDELKQDPDWVVKLRELPDTPETYYLLDLMASHDFQESLKNYLDLEDLRKRLEVWSDDLSAYEDLIGQRRAYYQPLLPEIDREFRRLDSRMRLRLEQRVRIKQRLQDMLVSPRPDYLATARERIFGERIARLEKAIAHGGAAAASADVRRRVRRLRGVLDWKIYTEYDQRLTAAYTHLRELNHVIDALRRQYGSFVRTRQAATQSYEGYEAVIRTQRARIAAAREKVGDLMARQGHMLEIMAVNELTKRRDRLEEFQIKARFAMADSYDRAMKEQLPKRTEQ
jgi:predicted negative regulator of RcsB-dependent stress response